MLARRIIFAVSIVLNLVLVYNLVWGERGTIAYKKLKAQSSNLEEKIRQVGENNLELSKEIRLLQSDEKYIEKNIRNRLNFVKNNEILYIFPDKPKEAHPGELPHEAEN